jgi:predicted phosphodiesterase
VKIALLSDIHSAAEHFRDALQAAREEGFDQLVILGDLLTYGPEPLESLEIAKDSVARDGAILITGNHDLLYFEGQEGVEYRARLPDWIRESVEWTSEQLGARNIAEDLPWQDEWQREGLYISHANPFGFRDWTYLRDEESMALAYEALRAKGCDWGVFGHVHRFRRSAAGNGDGGVVTIGSIGQPRDRDDPFSQWATVTLDPQFTIEQRRVARDWTSTIEKIQKTSLSDATKERLCQFYR